MLLSSNLACFFWFCVTNHLAHHQVASHLCKTLIWLSQGPLIFLPQTLHPGQGN